MLKRIIQFGIITLGALYMLMAIIEFEPWAIIGFTILIATGWSLNSITQKREDKYD